MQTFQLAVILTQAERAARTPRAETHHLDNSGV